MAKRQVFVCVTTSTLMREIAGSERIVERQAARADDQPMLRRKDPSTLSGWWGMRDEAGSATSTSADEEASQGPKSRENSCEWEDRTADVQPALAKSPTRWWYEDETAGPSPQDAGVSADSEAEIRHHDQTRENSCDWEDLTRPQAKVNGQPNGAESDSDFGEDQPGVEKSLTRWYETGASRVQGSIPRYGTFDLDPQNGRGVGTANGSGTGTFLW